jgi:hypothetical protein
LRLTPHIPDLGKVITVNYVTLNEGITILSDKHASFEKMSINAVPFWLTDKTRVKSPEKSPFSRTLWFNEIKKESKYMGISGNISLDHEFRVRGLSEA